MINSYVILVNENDEPTGIMEKMEVHQKALLHRAFSIFIFNQKGEMLLQQRSASKYHSSGLWSNACCGHPEPQEDTLVAASRRLYEEMGFVTSLEKIFDFVYYHEFENGLTENEFDHVFVGEYEGFIKIDPDEAKDYCYKKISEIRESLQMQPQKYTAWFQLAFPKVESWWKDRYEM